MRPRACHLFIESETRNENWIPRDSSRVFDNSLVRSDQHVQTPVVLPMGNDLAFWEELFA